MSDLYAVEERRVPVPRWVATVNRRFTNHVMRVVATCLPGFGIITHAGRRSGRRYRTPVNVFRVADGYVAALTYGVESDWVKNVIAAGGCELERRGQRRQLGSPRIVHGRDVAAGSGAGAARPRPAGGVGLPDPAGRGRA